MLKKEKDAVVRQALEDPVKGARIRGRQPKRWSDGLLERLEELGLNEGDAQECKKWNPGC